MVPAPAAPASFTLTFQWTSDQSFTLGTWSNDTILKNRAAPAGPATSKRRSGLSPPSFLARMAFTDYPDVGGGHDELISKLGAIILVGIVENNVRETQRQRPHPRICSDQFQHSRGFDEAFSVAEIHLFLIFRRPAHDFLRVRPGRQSRHGRTHSASDQFRNSTGILRAFPSLCSVLSIRQHFGDFERRHSPVGSRWRAYGGSEFCEWWIRAHREDSL